MPELTPRQIALYGLALLTLVVLAAWYAGRGDGTTAAAGASAAAPAIEVDGPDNGGTLVVHVAGAVHRPGVYRMRQGARVDDAVTRAGGPRRRADLGAVNLAAELEDGHQILVPLRARAASATTAAPGGGAVSQPRSGAAPQPGVPLNLNTATLEQLDTLQGIGPATAQQILDYREEHGGFGSVEELDRVPGIGETRLAALRDKVRV